MILTVKRLPWAASYVALCVCLCMSFVFVNVVFLDTLLVLCSLCCVRFPQSTAGYGTSLFQVECCGPKDGFARLAVFIARSLFDGFLVAVFS